MSAGRRSKAPAYWFEGGAVPVGARALAGIYATVVGMRRALYARGWLRRIRIARPVVVVGNLIAGGTGKTPLTIAIVKRLCAEGYTPGVATRGYGRSNGQAALWVDAQTDTALGGDEPVLIARRTGVRVRADRDRAAAARALVDAGCDVVICDDGLQHYRLQRDIEIEVIDGRRRYGNRRLLPAGPLREPEERGDACDFRVLNMGAPGALPDAHAERDAPEVKAGFGEWPMLLRGGFAQPLLSTRPRALSSFAGQRVHAVAGTGDPRRFFDMLRASGIGVVPHAFADHHVYGAADLQFGSDLPVLMTEKDAVKCAAFANDQHYSVPIDAVLPEAFWIALLARLGTVIKAKQA